MDPKVPKQVYVEVVRFATGEVAGVRATVSRTGYTGEDGFEVLVPPAQAERTWDAILQAGANAGVVPCGLGARDTLRLEASMRLCGSDMDEHTTVVEAGLGWIVGWKKNDFLGAAVLRAQKGGGLMRKLCAFEMRDRAIARHGYPVVKDGTQIGVVTSGTQTPFLKKAIGFAMLPVAMAAVGTPFEIEIRGRVVRAGKTTVIEVREGVPGEIILEEAGDAVPADARLLQASALQIAEAALTGESVPVAKDTRPLAADTALLVAGRGDYLGLVARDPRYITDALQIPVIGRCAAFAGPSRGAATRPTSTRSVRRPGTLVDRLATVAPLIEWAARCQPPPEDVVDAQNNAGATPVLTDTQAITRAD
jgi:hypothetical protein